MRFNTKFYFYREFFSVVKNDWQQVKKCINCRILNIVYLLEGARAEGCVYSIYFYSLYMPSKRVVQFEKFHKDCEFEKLKCNLPITINNLDWLISICLNVTLSVCCVHKFEDIVSFMLFIRLRQRVDLIIKKSHLFWRDTLVCTLMMSCSISKSASIYPWYHLSCGQELVPFRQWEYHWV